MQTSTSKRGEEFVLHVTQFLRDRLGDKAGVGGPLPTVEGASGNKWEPDVVVTDPPTPWKPIVVGGNKMLSGTFPPARAVIECKNISPARKGNTYDTSVARAYTELNDIGLKNRDLKLFLVVSRVPGTGEMKRDYKSLFNRIGVVMINFSDPAERELLSQEATSIFSFSPAGLVSRAESLKWLR